MVRKVETFALLCSKQIEASQFYLGYALHFDQNYFQTLSCMAKPYMFNVQVPEARNKPLR